MPSIADRSLETACNTTTNTNIDIFLNTNNQNTLSYKDIIGDTDNTQLISKAKIIAKRLENLLWEGYNSFFFIDCPEARAIALNCSKIMKSFDNAIALSYAQTLEEYFNGNDFPSLEPSALLATRWELWQKEGQFLASIGHQQLPPDTLEKIIINIMTRILNRTCCTAMDAYDDVNPYYYKNRVKIPRLMTKKFNQLLVCLNKNFDDKNNIHSIKHSRNILINSIQLLSDTDQFKLLHNKYSYILNRGTLDKLVTEVNKLADARIHQLQLLGRIANIWCGFRYQQKELSQYRNFPAVDAGSIIKNYL